MADKLQACPNVFKSEHFDLLLEELEDVSCSGKALILHNEELAISFSTSLSSVYPDHLFICCKGFQAICVNRESVDSLIELLQKNYSILLSQLNEIDTQLDFLFRRGSNLPSIYF